MYGRATASADCVSVTSFTELLRVIRPPRGAEVDVVVGRGGEHVSITHVGMSPGAANAAVCGTGFQGCDRHVRVVIAARATF